MNQQPKLRLSDPYERIVELESRLTQAHRYIKRLRKENYELHRQFSWLQGRQIVEAPKLPTRDVSRSPEKNISRRRRKKRPDKYGYPERIDSARGLSFRRRKRPWLRLAVAAIAAGAVLTVTVSSVSALVRLIVGRPTQTQTTSQPKPVVVVVPKVLDSPLLPPELPSFAEPRVTPSPQVSLENVELVYNATPAPELKPNQDLQAIVDELVDMAAAKGMPTGDLSITLINVKTNEIAGYQQQELRYPASVLKLFWLVYLYGGLEQKVFPDEAAFTDTVYQMIQQSSNDAASRIIDWVTGTRSGKKLRGEEYQTWLDRRMKLSEFFQKAGYEGIIVSQKTYPFLGIPKPSGRELQMWGDPDRPIQNKITSDHAARLMYEIVTGKAISPESSRKMARWLARDLSPAARADVSRYGDFNPIEGFFGKSLPPDIDFASKAGWTSTSRHEVAFVKTRDDKTAYILAVLGADRAYSNDGGFFPKISRLAFDRLSEPSSPSP